MAGTPGFATALHVMKAANEDEAWVPSKERLRNFGRVQFVIED